MLQRAGHRRILIGLILIVALGLRIGAAFWWEGRLAQRQRFAWGDSESYWALAGQIARGEPYQYGPGSARIFRTPGYPILLAGLFRIAGDEPPVLWARTLGAVFGTIAVGVVVWLTRELFSERAAIIAGCMAALYPGAIGMSVFVLSEAPFCPLMLAQIAAWVLALRCESPKWAAGFALAAGAIAGMATLVRPSWYGIITLKEGFPESAVKKAGISYGRMLAEFASPILLFLFFLHACVGYVELGTDSWITNITESLTGQGFLLFIYASALMFVLRFYAGPIVERINPLGLLCISAVLGTTGLLLLSSSQTAVMAWLAVTIYGLGKTFLWPTMLGIVGERFPRGGALTMGAMGGIGMLSAGLLGGPGIGYKQDLNASNQLKDGAPETFARYASEEDSGFLLFPKVKGLDGQKVGVLLDAGGPAKTLNRDIAIFEEHGQEIPASVASLKAWWDSIGSQYMASDARPVEEAKIHGGRVALKWTAAVPATMFVGYLILVLYFRSQGGYTTVEIDEEGHTHPTDHHPSAEEAIEEGEEGPTSGQA